MNDSNECEALTSELRNLIVTDCCKQVNNVQNCGLLIDVCDLHETLATGFAITDSGKKEAWLVEDMQILDKAEILQEKMNKKWDSAFIIVNLKNDKFSVEFYVMSEVNWRKGFLDGVGEWDYYLKVLEKL